MEGPSIAVYSIAANLVCSIPVHSKKHKDGDGNMAKPTIESLRFPVAEKLNVPPGLLKFMPFGISDAKCYDVGEDLHGICEVQVVVSLAKREEYLAQGKKHIEGEGGITEGERLADFLWEEISNGACVRCAKVRPREEVDMDSMLVFGAILENFQDAVALAEIFYLFDIQEEVVDPLKDNVLAPLEEILRSDRPDKTGSFIPMVVDWIEALVGCRTEERKVHVDCFLQALLEHVESNASFWTLTKRREAWRRDAKTDEEMTLCILWDVFERILDGGCRRLGTWPVLWDFMQRFAGIDSDTLKTVIIPGLQSDSAREHGYVPFYVYDAMRGSNDAWVELNPMYECPQRDLQTAWHQFDQRRKHQMKELVDFWVSFVELLSVADVKAIREGSRSQGEMYLVPKLVTIDFLSYPLAMEIPFLAECKKELLSASEVGLTKWLPRGARRRQA